MSIKRNYLNIIPYIAAGDERIAKVLKTGFQIRTCEFMFGDNEPIGRKYLEYKNAKLEEGKSIGEIVVDFVNTLDNQELQVLSNSNSLIGGKDVVLDYLHTRERIKRKGSVIDDVKAQEKQAGVLSVRVSEVLDNFNFYGARFHRTGKAQDRLNIINHLKTDETQNWQRPNIIEEIAADVAISKHYANNAKDIVKNMGDNDNNITNSYIRFANKMNEEYNKKSKDTGIEFIEPAPLETEKVDNRKYKIFDSEHPCDWKWKTYGELHPHEMSTSKLQKMLKPYNTKAGVKWLEMLLESINQVLVRVGDIDNTK